MSGLPVYYGIQNSDDTTLNVFFLPTTFKSYSEVKVKDIVENFPLSKDGNFYHFRFHAFCDNDQKSWVDISNMGSKAPVLDNKILIKVLQIKKPAYTRIFRGYYKSQNVSNLQENSRQQQPQPTVHQEVRKQPPPEIQKVASEGTRTVKPQPKNVPHVHSDDDLLGGDHSGFISAPQTQSNHESPIDFNNIEVPNFLNKQPSGTDTQTQSTDSADPTKGMTREQLDQFYQDKKAAAIDERVAAAKKQYEDEAQAQVGREKAYDEVEDGIRKWAEKDKQRNNIRTLLCTVHSVVWEGCKWNSLSLSDLMSNAQIKKNYYKAITLFHPDKNQEGDYKQKYISERITNELNAAWDQFRKENNM